MALWDRNIEKQQASHRAGLGNEDCINANDSACTADFLWGKPTAFVLEGETGKISGSCTTSDISYGKQVRLRRQALPVTASGLSKMRDQLFRVALASTGLLPRLNPKVYNFALALVELYPFGCWLCFFLSSRLFLKFGKVISNAALVFTCIRCHSEHLVMSAVIRTVSSPSPKSFVETLSSTGCWENPGGLPVIRGHGWTVSCP